MHSQISAKKTFTKQHDFHTQGAMKDDLSNLDEDDSNQVKIFDCWILIHRKNQLTIYRQQNNYIGSHVLDFLNHDSNEIFSFIDKTYLIVAYQSKIHLIQDQLRIYPIRNAQTDQNAIRSVDIEFTRIQFTKIYDSVYGLTNNLHLIEITQHDVIVKSPKKKNALISMFQRKEKIIIDVPYRFTVLNSNLIIAKLTSNQIIELSLTSRWVFQELDTVQISLPDIYQNPHQKILSFEIEGKTLYILAYSDKEYKRSVILIKHEIEPLQHSFNTEIHQEVCTLKILDKISNLNGDLRIKQGKYYVTFKVNQMNYFKSEEQDLIFAGNLTGFSVTDNAHLIVNDKIHQLNQLYSLEQDNSVVKDEIIYSHLLRSFQSYLKCENSFSSCIGNVCPVINFITKEFLKQTFSQLKDFRQQLNERIELLQKWKAFIGVQFPEAYTVSIIEAIVYVQCFIYILDQVQRILPQAVCADQYELYLHLNNTTIIKYHPTAEFIIAALDFLQSQKILRLTYFTQQAEFVELIPLVPDKELCVKLLQDSQHDHENFRQFLTQFNQGQDRAWLIKQLIQTKNHKMLLYFGDIPDILNACLENPLSYSVEFVTLWIDRFSMNVLQEISEHKSYSIIAESLEIYPKCQYFLKLIHGEVAQIDGLGALPFQYYKWLKLLKDLSINI